MTGWLAVKTRSVAVATRELADKTTELAQRTAEDVAAQFRPVLVPDVDGGPGDRSIDYNGSFLELSIRNAGNGPALSIDATDLTSGIEATEWNQGALPRDLTASILFSDFSFPAANGSSEVELTYKDLAGEKYKTVITIYGAPQGDGGVYFHIRDVRIASARVNRFRF